MRAISLGLIAALVTVTSAFAADSEKGAREAAARAQRMIGRLQQEKTVVEREKAELVAKLEAVNRELSIRRVDAGKARQRALELEKSLAAASQERDELKGKLGAMEARSVEAAGLQLREKREWEESSKRTLAMQESTFVARLQTERGATLAHIDTNQKLYGLARKILMRYEQDVERLGVPLIGLRLVELENRLQDLRDQVEELKLPK